MKSMRYDISGKLLKSENAAKPHSQKSGVVVDYLLSHSNKKNILDYGCGKLRYSDTLINLSSNITFVDSEIQLSRQQMVRGTKTTVHDYVSKNYSNCRTLSVEKISEHDSRYELITCTNVLSAIPCINALNEALKQIKRLLHRDGVAVFINQHRSSYFKKYESGSKHLHGFLYNGRRGTSYYGILNKQDTEDLLKNNGFIIKKSWCSGESNYIEVGK